MWATESRARHEGIRKRTKRYPSDLTDEEWSAVEPFLPKPAGTGSPRRVDMREVLNAIRHLVRSECSWSMLPIHFPSHQTVYGWFPRLARCLMLRAIHDIATMTDRAQSGRSSDPSAVVIDNRCVKAPIPGAERGYHGCKKIVGRKCHIAVDTYGRLLLIDLTPDNVSDSAGAQDVLDAVHEKWLSAKYTFADSAYDRGRLLDKAAFLAFILGIIKRTEAKVVVLPRRWVVEGTFALMTRHRRLARGYEKLTDVSEAMIEIAMGGLMIRRIAHP